MLPQSLRVLIERDTNCRIVEIMPVAGGDICRAYRLQCASGESVFLKISPEPNATDMFHTESLGLALLGASRVIKVPKVFRYGIDEDAHAFIILEYIAGGEKNLLFWHRFGIALANLHGNTSATFGFAHDNFIGRLPQKNNRKPDWPTFYAEQRLLPQMALALDNKLLGASDLQLAESLCARLGEICPTEAPALIHGDLWSGNFLCDPEGHPVLIDPAASFSHREMDLAMARLFGGFHPSFFNNYNEYWPLEPGFEKRIDVYQLYYILVHVNLFGGSYVQEARRILAQWGR